MLTGGENVYSREVEEVLHQHPAVAVAAVVESAPESTVDGDDVIGFCAQRLARYKCPRRVVEIPALPRNTVGKILKRELRRMLEEGAVS